ncbi:MAG: tetratricopeptide repeat protein, partial [Sporomusaceae bacterium]|nr:tetratricopeptide repeat protein [Sporomusaceae bacterium]
ANILRKFIFILTNNGKYSETIAYLEKCLAQTPNEWGILVILGDNLLQAEKYLAAARVYRQVLRLAQQLPPKLLATVYANLAMALTALGEEDAAIVNYQKSLSLSPDNAATHRNLATTLLKKGDFARGFAEFEWRKKTADKKAFYQKYQNSKPYWQGGLLQGKSLLIHHEQGLGDSIHFCRYLPLLKSLGGTVILLAPAPLKPLYDFWQKTGAVDLVAEQNDAALKNITADFVLPLMSLPYVLRLEAKEIFAHVPYLAAEKSLIDKWSAKIAAAGGKAANLKIGLVWAGNTLFPKDAVRSCSLAEVVPLAAVRDDIDFYSLQVGAPGANAPQAPAEMRFFDLTPSIGDFADTAALIANLDLVISVDTAVAHLAGALGKPVWTLIYYANDWRWFKDREDSPWYPAMRLFRQREPGGWDSVIEKVAKNLYSWQKIS